MGKHHLSTSSLSVALTLMVSPSISTAFSLKSTPMVASVLSGKLPPVKRKVRHVFPTLESPMTMILKIRVWMLSSREEVLRSTEDVRLWAASLLLLARLRLALCRSMDDVRMVTLSSARFLRAMPLPKPPPPPPPPPPLPPAGARVSSSGESLVMIPEEAMRKSVCCVRRGAARRGVEWGWTEGWMGDGRGEEEGRKQMQQYKRCSLRVWRQTGKQRCHILCKTVYYNIHGWP